MFCHGRVRFLAAALLIAAAACSSSTPTSPSSTSSGAPGTQNAAEDGAATTQDFTGGSNAVGATRFLAFGDSITFGTESSFDEIAFDFALDFAPCPTQQPPPAAYPGQLVSKLTALPSPQTFTVTNCGVPGEPAQIGAQRLASQLTAHRPQGLLLLEGINDLNGGRSVAETLGSLRTMIEIAQAHNVTVIIGTMFQTYEAKRPDGSIRDNSYQLVPLLNDGIRALENPQRNVYVVDFHHALGTNWAAGFVGHDGLHPTPAGYDRMANWLQVRIQEVWPVRFGFQ